MWDGQTLGVILPTYREDSSMHADIVGFDLVDEIRVSNHARRGDIL
jgi:hypothetical protein